MDAILSTRRNQVNRQTARRTLRAAAHLGSLLPLVWLGWQYQQDLLGVDPVRAVILRTGKMTLILLILTLAVTPAKIVFGWKQLLPLRRILGLYMFLYVNIHLWAFAWLDYGLDWEFIPDGIFDQRYVLAGFAAYLILIPLALTSNKWSMRRLGKNWKRLHKLVYLIGGLGLIHFVWLVKNVYTLPILYGSVMVLLLLLRVGPVKQWVLRMQRRVRSRLAAKR